MKQLPSSLARRMGRIVILVLTGTIIAWILAKKEMSPIVMGSPRDYDAIAAEGVLHVVTDYGPLSMQAEGDSINGLHFELVKAFAHDHHLTLEIQPQLELGAQLDGLSRGRYDLIAAGIPVTTAIRDSLLLSQPLLTNRQLLVQRKPLTAEDSARFVESQIDLAQKRIHLVKGSPALMRIHHLASEMADTIYIEEVDRYGAEQLLFLVAHGDIDYAVCDEQTASAVVDSLPQLDLHVAVGFTQLYAWGTSKESHALMDSINTWLSQYLASNKGRALYRRYHQLLPETVNPKSSLQRR